MEYRKHTSLKDLAQALGVSIPTGIPGTEGQPGNQSRALC